MPMATLKENVFLGLAVQRFSLLSSWWGAWWHKGSHGAEEVAENSTSGLAASKKTVSNVRPS